MEENNSFKQWCIVELFGRQVIAGLVTEQVIGGTSFIRVDVPEVEGNSGFTRFYGNGAIYAMTPLSEEAAMVVLKRFRPEPVNVYVPELAQLAAGRIQFEEDNDYDEEF